MAATEAPAPDSPRHANPVRTWAAIGLVLALAGVLRATRLGHQSLNLDEAVTWWNATRQTWIASAFAEPNHAPLWWLVTRAFIAWFGDREMVLRAPAALAGIVSVWLTWLLARALLDPDRAPSRAGIRGIDPGAPIFIAALAAIHPFWIEYSQDARMYSLLLAESLGLSLLYLKWLESGRNSHLIAYSLLAAFALYTHHFALLTLAGHASFAIVLAVFERRASSRHSPGPILLAQAAAMLLFLPWALRSLGSGVSVPTFGNFGRFQRLAFALWRISFGPALAALDRPRIDAGPMSLFRDEAAVLIAGAVLAALALAFAWRALRRDPIALGFMATSLLVPAGILLLVFSRLPLLHEKYLIMIAPFVAMVLVIGARAAPRALRTPLLGALFALELLGSLAYFAPRNLITSSLVVHGHPYGKEDWRDARAWVAERVGPRDIVLLYPSYMHIPWDFYDRGRLQAAALRTEPSSLAELSAASPGWGAAPRVFLLVAGTPPVVRQRLVARLSRWTTAAQEPDSTGLVASRLFPYQWGVWAYELRGAAWRR